jgi:hypothetical protein
MGLVRKLKPLMGFDISRRFFLDEAERRTDQTNTDSAKREKPNHGTLTCFIIRYRLRNKEWKLVEDRFEKKLASWLGKLLSYRDRLVLINYVLTSLLMFMLSFFEIPKEVWRKG